MEYRQLRSFIVLAQELHFGNAALRLNIAQPALSQHIKALEKTLGVMLFTRNKRNVALTYEGRLLVKEARIAVSHYDKLRESARSLQQGFRGQLRLGYVGSSLLDPAVAMLINGYRERRPDIDIVIEEFNVNNQLSFLQADRLDVALVRSPIPRFDELAYLDVARRSLIAALPRHHPLAGRAQIALSDLADSPFLIQEDPPGVGLGWAVLQACEQAGFVPKTAQITRDISGAVGLVSMGMGVALVPETQRSMALTDVSYSSLEDVNAATTLTLSWKRHVKNPALDDFIQYVRALTQRRAGREGEPSGR